MLQTLPIVLASGNLLNEIRQITCIELCMDLCIEQKKLPKKYIIL